MNKHTLKTLTFSKQLSKKANRESCAVTNDLCSINLLNICGKKNNYIILQEKVVRVPSLTSSKDAQKINGRGRPYRASNNKTHTFSMFYTNVL